MGGPRASDFRDFRGECACMGRRFLHRRAAGEQDSLRPHHAIARILRATSSTFARELNALMRK